MKLLSVFVATGAVAAGVAGGAYAYGSTHVVPEPVKVAQRVYPKPAVVKPAPVFRWADCPRGTTLQQRVCVRHVVHTITLPALAAPAAPAAPAPAAPPSSPAPASHEAEPQEHESAEDPADDETNEPEDQESEPPEVEHEDNNR